VEERRSTSKEARHAVEAGPAADDPQAKPRDGQSAGDDASKRSAPDPADFAAPQTRANGEQDLAEALRSTDAPAQAASDKSERTAPATPAATTTLVKELTVALDPRGLGPMELRMRLDSAGLDLRIAADGGTAAIIAGMRGDISEALGGAAVAVAENVAADEPSLGAGGDEGNEKPRNIALRGQGLVKGARRVGRLAGGGVSGGAGVVRGLSL
jgi:hypothetical protein